ncbi:oncoprotein-induced transcript 3 protein-like isoform X2 [Watersipora subatra]|uniref:oncoprotein-induced transcript 3 protein-like isoform X2 n=1 Tax=Watersipora subatra TaxID=2589382 RepID=UPI00355B7CAA
MQAKVDASTTTTTEMKVDTIMSAVQEHCTARKKRQVGPSSEDKVRRLILNVVKDCLEDDDTPGPTTTSKYTTTSSTTQKHTTTSSTTQKHTTTSSTTQKHTTTHPVGGPCTSFATVNLTEDWRLDNKGSDIKPINGDYNCDAPLFDNVQWFRITGAAGNRIRNSCSPPYSCGSHGGIWTNATHPISIGDTWQVPLYGSWADNCDWYPWVVDNPLTVTRCGPGNDFVYKIDGLAGCFHSVCGMWA